MGNSLSDTVGFVQAWVADFEYDYWQNAQDPLLYQAAGRDYSRLPMKSNGLPPPVAQQIIDTSKNPGRWSLRQGYVEAIGATMWLGQAFFRYVGEDVRRSLLSTAWPEVEALSDRVLKLSAAPSCFKDESNASAQVELRKRIYKVDQLREVPRPAAELDVTRFERANNLSLPKSYRRFLSEQNGGRPRDGEFPVPGWGVTVVDTFFGIGTGDSYDLQRQLDRLADPRNSDLLPIATDPAAYCYSSGSAALMSVVSFSGITRTRQVNRCRLVKISNRSQPR